MKLLTHNSLLQCCHGGKVQLKSPCQHSMTSCGSEMLCKEDIEEAVIEGCNAPHDQSKGFKRCEKVTTLLTGEFVGISVDGHKPLLMSFLALTDCLPVPGTCSATDDGGSNVEVAVSSQIASAPPKKPFVRDEGNKGYIGFDIKDKTGNSIIGEWFRLTLPDGSEFDDFLKGGRAEVKNTTEGECTLTFPLLEIKHKVTGGETIRQIATRYYGDEKECKRIWKHKMNKGIRKVGSINDGDEIVISSPSFFRQHTSPTPYAITVDRVTSSLKLRYERANGDAISNAEYVIKTFHNGKIVKKGPLEYDANGVCKVDGLPGSGPFEVYFHKDGDSFKYYSQEIAKPKAYSDKQINECFGQLTKWFKGVFQGGFNKQQTLGQSFLDMILSCVPYVGEVSDIREIASAVVDLLDFYEKVDWHQEEQEDSEIWLWAMLVVSVICALIPFVGAVLAKKVIKWCRKFTNSGVYKAAKGPLQQVWDKAIRQLNFFGIGNTHKELKEIKNILFEQFDKVCDFIIRLFHKIQEFAFQFAKKIAGGIEKVIIVIKNHLNRAKIFIEKLLDDVVTLGKHPKTEVVKRGKDVTIGQLVSIRLSPIKNVSAHAANNPKNKVKKATRRIVRDQPYVTFEKELKKIGKYVEKEPGFTDVYIHADRTTFWVKDEPYTPQDIAEALRGKTKGPIRLIACDAGMPPPGAESLAQKLANEMNVDVKAPNTYVDALYLATQKGAPVKRPLELPEHGEWILFKPGG